MSIGRAVTAYVFTASLVLLAPVASFAQSSGQADAAPSNAELFKMIQELKSEQSALLNRVSKAEQEADAAKAELAQTKEELAAARNQIVASTQPSIPAGHDYAPHTTMGSQLSDAAVMVDRAPGWYVSVLAGPMFLGEEGYDFGFVGPSFEDVLVNQRTTQVSGSMQSAADDAVGVSIEGTIGKRLGSGMELSATLAYANVENSNSLRAENSVQVVTLASTNDAAGEFADFARSKVDVTRWYGDLDGSKTLTLGSNVDLRVVGGVRIANIDQNWNVVAQSEDPFDIPNAFADGTKLQSNELTGAGPKVAADFNWRLGNFTLGGSGTGALILANRDYTLRQTGSIQVGNQAGSIRFTDIAMTRRCSFPCSERGVKSLGTSPRGARLRSAISTRTGSTPLSIQHPMTTSTLLA